MSENPGPSKRSRKQVLVPREEMSSVYLRPPSPDQVAATDQPSRQEVQAGERQISLYATSVFRLIKLGMVDQRRVLLSYTQTTNMGKREKNHSAFINGEVEDLLKEVCDASTGFWDVLPNLCRLTEIRKDTGSCLGDCFKLRNGKYSHEVGSDVAYMSLRKSVYGNYDTMPNFLWVNIHGSRKPITIPTKKVLFCKRTLFKLIGFVYGGPEQFFTVVTHGNRGLRRQEDGKIMSSMDIIEAMSSTDRPFSFLYHKVNSMPIKASALAPVCDEFMLTQADIAQINEALDNRRGRRKSSGMHFLNPEAEQASEKLLRPQMAARAILYDRHLPEKRSQFLLSSEDFDELHLRVGAYTPILLYSDILGEEGNAARTGLRVSGRNIWTAFSYRGTFKANRSLCSRCLMDDVEPGIYIDEKAYCPTHFPDGSVEYVVYAVYCSTNCEDNYVDWNVSLKGERTVKPSDHNYDADLRTVEICPSIEEVSLKFHAMTIALWLRNVLSGRPVKIKSMWPTHSFDRLNTERLIENISIFQRFDIYINKGAKQRTSSWDREEALRYGFLFGDNQACLKNVYSFIYEKNETQNGVYIGKNANKYTIASGRKRRDVGPVIDEQCVALTPNLDMLNFLESVFTLNVGVASILGIQMKGCSKPPVLKNFMMPVPSRKPANVKTEEYLTVIFKHLFNVDIRLELNRDADADEVKVNPVWKL